MLKVKVNFKLGRRLVHALSTTMVSYKGLCSWVIACGLGIPCLPPSHDGHLLLLWQFHFVNVTDRREEHTDAVQTGHTSLQLAPHVQELRLQCECRQTCQRTSRCLPVGAETARPCQHTEVLQHSSVSPAVKIHVTLLFYWRVRLYPEITLK